jgi:hypothetical protein
MQALLNVLSGMAHQFVKQLCTPAGQGFGQAAEDAHELALQVRAHGFTPEALRAYEAARVQRMQRVADTEWVSCFLPHARRLVATCAVHPRELQRGVGCCMGAHLRMCSRLVEQSAILGCGVGHMSCWSGRLTSEAASPLKS